MSGSRRGCQVTSDPWLSLERCKDIKQLQLPSLPYVNVNEEHLLVFGLVSGAGVGEPGLAGLGLVLINDFA